MFEALMSRLKSSDAAEPDGRRALGALLVRVAKADANYAVEEIRAIDRLLAARYGLNPLEAVQLREECQKLEAAGPRDTMEFARIVKDSVDYAERSAIVAALWDVVLADGERRAEEEAVFAHVAAALGVDTSDLTE